jgi:hypothetical protein
MSGMTKRHVNTCNTSTAGNPSPLLALAPTPDTHNFLLCNTLAKTDSFNTFTSRSSSSVYLFGMFPTNSLHASAARHHKLHTQKLLLLASS